MHFDDTGFIFQYNNAFGTHTDHTTVGQPDMNLTRSLESKIERHLPRTVCLQKQMVVQIAIAVLIKKVIESSG
jgi:hypothetical protein